MGRASGRKKRQREKGGARDMRQASGSHYTPWSLVQRIVPRTLEPHLRWMTEDPEGWDKAHDRRPPPRPMGPHQFASQYPLPCGCWPHYLKRECPEHRQEAEASRARNAERRRRQEAEALPAQLGLLELAVPMWIEEFRNLSWDERMKVRDQCLVGLGIGTDDGDALAGIAAFACGSVGKPGQVAGAFNALAKGLALGALQPGGVTFAGMHFEATDAP